MGQGGLGGEYRVKGSGGFGEIRGHGGMECGHPIICYLSIGLFSSTIFFLLGAKHFYTIDMSVIAFVNLHFLRDFDAALESFKQ